MLLSRTIIWSIFLISVQAANSAQEASMAYNEYLGHLYGVGEDWWAFSEVYGLLKESCNACAEAIMTQHVTDKNVRKHIQDGKMQNHQGRGGLVSTFKSLIPGVNNEWPDPKSTLNSKIELARTLLKFQKWELLEQLALEEILTHPDYEKYILPRKIIVATGLALLDFSKKYPNCIAPWKTVERGGSPLTVKKKAKIIAAILRLRAGKIIISDPKKACEEIGIRKDVTMCVRVLVAGGYKRAEELFDNVKSYDELTLIAGCYKIWTRGSEEAFRYYDSRTQVENDEIKNYVNYMRGALKPLSKWYPAAKRLSAACPCQRTELPMARQLRRSDIISKERVVAVENSEKLFWVLIAAQYKEMAKTMLTKVKAEVEPILSSSMSKKVRSKLEAILEYMGDMWQTTDLISLPHVSNHQKLIDSAIDGLTRGNILAAEKALEQVIEAVRQNSSDYLRIEENPSVMFLTLLVTAFRNPQILAPEAVQLLNFKDWKFNWYVARAIEQYSLGSSHIELVDDSVEKDLFEKHRGLLLFFSGRFQEVLGLKGKVELPEEIWNYSTLCSLQRSQVCGALILKEFNDKPAELAASIQPSLCEALKNSRGPVKKNHPRLYSVFSLTPIGMKVLKGIDMESYLQPPLPTEEMALTSLIPIEPSKILRIIEPPLTLDLKKQSELAAQRAILFEQSDKIMAEQKARQGNVVAFARSSDQDGGPSLFNSLRTTLMIIKRARNPDSQLLLSRQQKLAAIKVGGHFPQLSLEYLQGRPDQEKTNALQFLNAVNQCDESNYCSIKMNSGERRSAYKGLKAIFKELEA